MIMVTARVNVSGRRVSSLCSVWRDVCMYAHTGIYDDTCACNDATLPTRITPRGWVLLSLLRVGI